MTQDRLSAELPPGVYFDDQRGVVVQGIVARQLAEHPLGRRPNRTGFSVALNDLAANTAMTIYLVALEPGDAKCDHRHLDETLTYVVSGEGYSEVRQDDARDVTRFSWRAGDLYATPMNAWHRHVNSGSVPARLLSFKNAPVIQRMLGASAADVADVRLRDRFDDESGSFAAVRQRDDGTFVAGHVAQVGAPPPDEDDPDLGIGIAAQSYVLGGHRMLGCDVLRIRPGGRMAPTRPAAEEAMVCLRGQVCTEIWSDDTAPRPLAWRAGDLLSVPLGVWRQHANDGPDDAVVLRVQNLAIPLALGLHEPDTRHGLPQRFPEVLDVREPRI